MSKFILFVSLVLASLFGLNFCAAASQPNVIVVITDDQGYGDLSCHGNPWLKTPELDRIYKESCRLTNFHVSPTCAPSRASLLTGRYCNRTGVWHTIMGRSLLNESEETLADIFQAAGYSTAIFGKWHLGDNHGLHPHERGFTTSVVHGGGGVGQTPDIWGNDYFDDTYLVNGTPTKFEGYCTDIWFNEASRFIEKHQDDPFLIYLSTNAPHSPFNVDPSYSKPYTDNPDIISADFFGMIANIDENLGKLDRKLESLGLKENTIFIFLSDNGTAAGFDPHSQKGFNAGMRGKKASHYDGGHRVPCFIRWPNQIEAGRDVPQITAHIDMVPTLMDLCGVDGRKGLPLDGKSLTPLLKSDSEDWPERVLVVDNQRENFPQIYKEYAVMTDRWRLCGNRQAKELFDMQADPGQTQDVSREHRDVVKQLSEAYYEWWNAQEPDYVVPQPAHIGLPNKVEKLTAHDWHSYEAYKVWDQPMIRQGPIAHGTWLVEVQTAGTYEFRVRRWPEEEKAIINKNIPIVVSKAKVEIGGQTAEVSVDAEAEEAVIVMSLTPGKTMLNAEFLSNEGESMGAYYVYAKLIADDDSP